MDKKTWFYVAIMGLIVSIGSLFTSIITYVSISGEVYQYSIIDLLQGDDFSDMVLSQYTGKVLWQMTGSVITGLVILMIASLLCAIIALFTLRAQYPNKWQFMLAIISLIGVAFPSFLVILAVILSGNFFNGTISCGVAPIVSPIAIVICIIAVVRRKNKVDKDLKERTKGLIWQAGDL